MLADLPSKFYGTNFKKAWENERTATPVKAFTVRLLTTGCPFGRQQQFSLN